MSKTDKAVIILSSLSVIAGILLSIGEYRVNKYGLCALWFSMAVVNGFNVYYAYTHPSNK